MLKRIFPLLLCACTVANAAVLCGGDIAFYSTQVDKSKEMQMGLVPYLKFNANGPWSARLKLVVFGLGRLVHGVPITHVPVLFEMSARVWSFDSLPVSVHGSGSAGVCLSLAGVKFAYEALLSVVVDAGSGASFRAFAGYATSSEDPKSVPQGGQTDLSLSGLTLGVGANFNF